MTAIASLLSTTAVPLPGAPAPASGTPLAPFPMLVAPVVDTAAATGRQALAATGNALPVTQGDDALAWLGVGVEGDAASVAGALVSDAAGAGPNTVMGEGPVMVASASHQPASIMPPGERMAGLPGRRPSMPVTVATPIGANADPQNEALPSTDHADVKDDAAEPAPSAESLVAVPLPAVLPSVTPRLTAVGAPRPRDGDQQQAIGASPVMVRAADPATVRQTPPHSGPVPTGAAAAPSPLAPVASPELGSGVRTPVPAAQDVAGETTPVLVAEQPEQHGAAVERFATPARFQAEPAISAPAVRPGGTGNSEVNAPARVNSSVRVPEFVRSAPVDGVAMFPSENVATASSGRADTAQPAPESGTFSRRTRTIAPATLGTGAALPLVVDTLHPAAPAEPAKGVSVTTVAGSTPTPLAVAVPQGGTRVGQPLAHAVAGDVFPPATTPSAAPQPAITAEAAITAPIIPAASNGTAASPTQPPRVEQAPPSGAMATPVGFDRPVVSEKPSTPITVPLAPVPRTAASDGSAAPVASSARAAQVFAAAIHRALGEQDARRPTDPAPTLAAPAPALVAGVGAAGSAHAGTLDMRHGSWPAVMIERIASLRDMAAENDTKLRLSPDMLGTIDVSLKRDGDAVQVQISAEQAQTRQMLAEAQPRLAELADARGVKLHLSGAPGGSAEQQAGSGPGQHAGGDAPRQQAAPASPFSTRPRSAAPRGDADAHDERIA
ncbi:flagellar hook-length control protein FliK [uncultured Sphingomonas sp.]|uniref:flagellar hook-length control protein FliK n=1 Tax=uncultured Sphingomonas sp. TaxID=158754 RepID=UPI002617B8C6|nr:flagellar hook-length control protein FliK [uncultured Sphingomonas sp.]